VVVWLATKHPPAPVLELLSIQFRLFSVLVCVVSDEWNTNPTMMLVGWRLSAPIAIPSPKWQQVRLDQRGRWSTNNTRGGGRSCADGIGYPAVNAHKLVP
jgi:hypothetical protein